MVQDKFIKSNKFNEMMISQHTFQHPNKKNPQT